MKYADGPTADVEVAIAAPPERVWEIVSDIELPVRFSSELQEVRWLDGDAPRPGARFVGRNAHPAGGEWETTCTVTVWEPPRRFAWAVGDPSFPSAEWGFEVQPVEAGSA